MLILFLKTFLRIYPKLNTNIINYMEVDNELHRI
jgi:hypothetical protein